MIKRFNLRRFEDGGNGGTGGNGGAGGNGGQGNAGITYSFEQAEQIANERASRATSSALRSYFTQQGMTQEQAEEAMRDYRTRQAQNNPANRVTELERQLAESNEKLQTIENGRVLADLGVSKDFTDFVMYEVSKLVTDKKDFKTAAAEYLKEHTGYTSAGNYHVRTGISGNQSGSNAENKNETINNMIRGALGRR